MPEFRRAPCRRMLAAAIAIAALLPSRSAQAFPSPVSLHGAVEVAGNASGRTTRSALVAGTLDAGFRATAGVLRYDDSEAGAGSGFLVGAGFPLLPFTHFNLQVTRFAGDETFRAWRVLAGPTIELPLGGIVGVSYVGQDESGNRTHGLTGEAAIPIAGLLSLRTNGSFASHPGGLRSLAGAAGLGWQPVPFLEIAGEVGVARNGALLTSTAAPPSRPLDLPVLGEVGGEPGAPETREETRVGATFLLGVRARFP